MTYEVVPDRHLTRIFNNPFFQRTIIIISLFTLITSSILIGMGAELLAIILSFLFGLLIITIVFIITWYNKRTVLKSVNLTDSLIIEFLRRDKVLTCLTFSFSSIHVDYYELSLGFKYSLYNEKYRVLVIQNEEKLIFRQDAKDGWTEELLNDIYENITLKKEELQQTVK